MPNSEEQEELSVPNPPPPKVPPINPTPPGSDDPVQH